MLEEQMGGVEDPSLAAQKAGEAKVMEIPSEVKAKPGRRKRTSRKIKEEVPTPSQKVPPPPMAGKEMTQEERIKELFEGDGPGAVFTKGEVVE